MPVGGAAFVAFQEIVGIVSGEPLFLFVFGVAVVATSVCLGIAAYMALLKRRLPYHGGAGRLDAPAPEVRSFAGEAAARLSASPKADAAASASPSPSLEETVFLAGLDSVRGVLVRVYRTLIFISGVALLGGSIYLFTIATSGNGLALPAIILLVLSFGVFAKMSAFDRPVYSVEKEPASGWPRLQFSFQESQPSVHSVAREAIQRAGELLRQGRPIDAVCREVHPPYSGWGEIQQRVFRAVLAEALKQDSGE